MSPWCRAILRILVISRNSDCGVAQAVAAKTSEGRVCDWRPAARDEQTCGECKAPRYRCIRATELAGYGPLRKVPAMGCLVSLPYWR